LKPNYSQANTRFQNVDSFKEWTTEAADEVYQISRWGEGYFAINQTGDMCVLPQKILPALAST